MAILPREDVSTIYFCDECGSYLESSRLRLPWQKFCVVGWPGLWHACSEECALKIKTWCIVSALQDGVCRESKNRN